MTLVQLQSFNNQVGWNTDLLPDALSTISNNNMEQFFYSSQMFYIILSFFFLHSQSLKLVIKHPRGS